MPLVWPSETPVNWKGGLVNQSSTLANQNPTSINQSSTLVNPSATLVNRSSTTDDKSSVAIAKNSVFIAPNEGFANPSEAIAAYRAFAAGKSDLERTELSKEKSGIFTGAYAINPVNGEKIPIWIADYVLASYGTGAIMAVPAHDERDMDFAKKYGLKIICVVGSLTPLPSFSYSKIGYKYPLNEGELKVVVNGEETFVFYSFERCFSGEGIAINSANNEVSLNNLPTPEAKKKITAWLEEKDLGKKTINFKLRDWLFSRQRYWGEPFPIIWKKDAAGNLYHEALPESSLPLLPPSLEDYKPTADGQPPLARAKDWVNLPDGSIRETNTMPQWAGSCWYYLRYLDAKNSAAFVGKDVENYWMGGKSAGVDLYVGGTEHAVLHLLYARFWHKVLFDLGYVSTPEPFYKLVNQGMVLGEDNQKMSKSRGNVIPVDVPVAEAGTDALRLYEMFMGPLEMVKPWSTKGVEGVYRFLGRVWRLFVDEPSETEFEQAETLTTKTQSREELLGLIKLNAAIQDVAATPAQLKTLHACIKKVTEDLDGLRFNTAISAMMVFVNDAITWETKPVSVLREFLILLQPFAPHLAEELWAKLPVINSKPPTNLAYAPWPKFDPALLVESEMEIPVQVNGKFRDVIKVAADANNAAIEAAAKASEKVQQFIAGKTVKKVIIVPKKMVNIVAA
jgi:leucyl-tRNA synthetase